ncbi:MAG: M16 family metallopeptidase [Gemmatimonadota bacterium]
MKNLLIPSILTLALAFTQEAGAQQLSDTLTSDPDVTIGRLPNGLTYYIRENRKPEARAELRLAVNAGSVLEDAKQLGLAHFAEHMAFNGTEHFAKQDLVHYLESIGMRFGADLNAYTSFDETVYMLTVPTDTGRALAQGIQILEDWAHRQSFDAQEIDKERGVVIEEWRLGQGADERMRDQYFPVLFANSRYAERLPIGTRESLEGFAHADLIRFYREWYRPDLMAVIAVGDFDKDSVAQLIRSHFSRLEPTGTPSRTVYPVPDHDSTLVSIVTDKEATVAEVAIYHKLPPSTETTVADYRLMLARGLFTAMLNARFYELAQAANPPFIGASSAQGSLIRSKEAFVLSAATRDDGILRGLEAIATEGARIQQHGFTATELERAKQNLLRGFERAHAEREHHESSDYAGEYVSAYLEAEPIPGIATEYELAKQLLPHIPVQMVNALVNEWISDRNRVVVIQAPEKPSVQVPSRADVLEAFARVNAKEIMPYDDRFADSSLVPELPAAGSVVAEKRDSATGITEWQLSNGVRVLLKPTGFKADEVLLRAYSPGGSSLVSDEDFISATTATFLVALSGIGELSAVDLGKSLAGKAVRVSPYIDARHEGFSAQASPKDLETMFQLIYLHATSPRRDTTAYQSLKTRLAAVLANQSASPEAAFRDTLEVTLAQHHFRARPFTVALIDEIQLDRALAIYRDRFADASDFTFVIVGSFMLDSIRPLVLRYLGALPASQRMESWRDRGVRPPTGVITKTVRKGVEPKSVTQLVFTGPFTYTADSRLALSLMRDVLDMRLRDAIREELGGTYGVEVGQSTEREPMPTYAITISFAADPARLEALTTRIFAEIEKLKTAGVTAEEVAKVKETQRRQWEVNLEQNGYWLGQIAGRDRAGERIADLLSFPARLESVTAEQIKRAAALMRTDNYVRVSLLPEKR